MKMLLVLLAKDLRRAWRNPLPWLTNLAIPICITGLIGVAFGGKSDNGALGRIRFAVVDEDKSALSKMLRGAAGNSQNNEHFEPVFMERADALREINANKISAVLIIPTNFMSDYLSGSEPVSLELIKNPAESVHPAVLEEMMGAVVTGLNAIERNFQSDFPEVQNLFMGDADYHEFSGFIERAGDKLKTVKQYINPPLVSYDKEVHDDEAKADGSPTTPKKAAPAFNLFAYLLIGMAAMFLLFLANNGMSDLHREIRHRTFERYHTLNQRLLPFVAAKVVFTIVMLLLGSTVMLGGGALIFRFHWQHPFGVAVLMLGYASFAACLMALLTALMEDERRANMLNNLAGMLLGMAGGCAFPADQLPGFVRNNITPLLPSFWFVDTARNLEFGDSAGAWVSVAIKLAVLSLILLALAAFVFRRRFKAGLKT